MANRITGELFIKCLFVKNIVLVLLFISSDHGNGFYVVINITSFSNILYHRNSEIALKKLSVLSSTNI